MKKQCEYYIGCQREKTDICNDDFNECELYQLLKKRDYISFTDTDYARICELNKRNTGQEKMKRKKGFPYRRRKK